MNSKDEALQTTVDSCASLSLSQLDSNKSGSKGAGSPTYKTGIGASALLQSHLPTEALYRKKCLEYRQENRKLHKLYEDTHAKVIM